ncbi:putative gustatory receptor 28b [Bombus vancouverensis nearcticus]|uniref:putative gustatory receptor 28b n=1 Tax=Bombus vancouverensis nearcticus TaxID=2705178 RepID=UPI00402BC79A
MLYLLGLLTFKAAKVTNEIEKAENLVHALLNCTIDRQIKVELEQFSLQLLHREIKFAANQYFTLNNTLFQSMSKEYLIDLISARIYGDFGCRCLPLQLHAMIIVRITSFRTSDTVSRR